MKVVNKLKEEHDQAIDLSADIKKKLLGLLMLNMLPQQNDNKSWAVIQITQ